MVQENLPFYNILSMGENAISFEILRRQYDENTIRLIKEVSKLMRKKANLKNRKVFLLRCKSENLTPTFLKLNTKHVQFMSTHLRHKFEEQVTQKFVHDTLNMLISDTVIIINNLESKISQINSTLKETLTDHLFNTISDNQKINYEHLFLKIKDINIKKINSLLKQKNLQCKNKILIQDDWLENLSDVQIPDYAVEILSLGPGFAMPIDNKNEVPIPDIIANIETSIKHLNNDNKDEIRATCCNMLTNFNPKPPKYNHNNQINKELVKNLNKTKSFLKNHKNLKILKPDKSNKTVIMTDECYDAKMYELLNDQTTYKQIKTDPTNTFQKQNNELIKRWEKLEFISPKTAQSLLIHNALSPRIYGLPKLHKNGVPMRPIVSCVQSPLSKLAKFLKNILNNIVNKSNSYIKDSWHFKEKIKNVEIPENYKIISLDVVSLYTNIPIELALKLIEGKWGEIKKFTDIPLDEFQKAISLTLNSTYFSFKNTFYKQIDGCAMGSSISSVVAQLVLEELEAKIISELKFNLPFYVRYVDDCLTAVPHDQDEYILKMFNSYHEKIRFTLEPEINNSINFLDMTVHHTNRKIETEWYTKATWSGRYLNYLSNHPMSQKRSVVIGLADRSIKLSDQKYREKAIEKAKRILKQNSYPNKLINSIFNSRLLKIQTQNLPQTTKKENNNYLVLPYITGLSENFKNVFNKHNITICHKAHNLIQNCYSQLKTKIPKNKKTHTIYEVPCAGCNQVYIGQTSQYLESRLNGHKYDKKNQTALSKHARQHNHTFNFQDTKILKTEYNQQKREIHEMICIKQNPNSLNAKTDIKNLNKIYYNIL